MMGVRTLIVREFVVNGVYNVGGLVVQKIQQWIEAERNAERNRVLSVAYMVADDNGKLDVNELKRKLDEGWGLDESKIL